MSTPTVTTVHPMDPAEVKEWDKAAVVRFFEQNKFDDGDVQEIRSANISGRQLPKLTIGQLKEFGISAVLAHSMFAFLTKVGIIPEPASPHALTTTQRPFSEEELRGLKRQLDSFVYAQKRARFTLTSFLDIGKNVLDETKYTDFKFFSDTLLLHGTNLDGLDLSPYEQQLNYECSRESDVQEKFNTFFTLIFEKVKPDEKVFYTLGSSRFITDTSSSWYFTAPTAKIDFSVLSGTIIAWPQLVAPIELKTNIGAGSNKRTEALGQVADRFASVFQEQPDRKTIFGAICDDKEIEFLWQEKEIKFKRSGTIPLDLTNKDSLGLRLLFGLLTASDRTLGYISADNEKDLVERIPGIKFRGLIARRSSVREGFIAAAKLNSEDVVVKFSTDNHEKNVLRMLASARVDLIPQVLLYREIGSYMCTVMKPYGRVFTLTAKDDAKAIFNVLIDVAVTIKTANQYGILHRDIKPSNVVVFNSRGYLIDWGVASHGGATDRSLSATPAFCSIRVLDALCGKTNDFRCTLDDDIESLFYTCLAVFSGDALCWEKGFSSADYRAHKIAIVYHDFEHQLDYVSPRFHGFLRSFRNLLFGTTSRKEVVIDAVIKFLQDACKSIQDV